MPTNNAAPEPVGFIHQFWTQLWKTLVAGLMVWTPMLVTVWVTWFLTDKLIFGVEGMIQHGVEWLNHMGELYPVLNGFQSIYYRQGLGLLICALLFLTTGFLTRYLLGRRLIAFGEHLLQRIPLIRPVYRATKQIRDAVVNRPGSVFQKVCAIEYPRPGCYGIGFVTSEDSGVLKDVYGKELWAIFVPCSPSPTSGYLLYLHPSEVQILDVSVEDAMKAIVSAGAFAPAKQTALVRGDTGSNFPM